MPLLQSQQLVFPEKEACSILIDIYVIGRIVFRSKWLINIWKGNPGQNHREITVHTHPDDWNEKDWQQFDGDMEQLVLGMETGITTLDNYWSQHEPYLMTQKFYS